MGAFRTMTELSGAFSIMTELLGAGEEEGSMEGAPVATGWGGEKGVGSSWGRPVAGVRGRSPSVAWLDNFFQGLDLWTGTGGRGLAIDQWICLYVT